VREWIAKPPQDQIINYGTKIVVRDLTLPDGSVAHYWRVLRMLATSYTAATSGKPRSNPEYGLTFLGMTAGRGIVAVDPRTINLRSIVYVPGYGLAQAGDTGGGIRGRRIDLGFPDSSVEDWFRWVNVYLLAPPPALNQINYVVSDYPVERSRSER
jgi:3D (Asp-Asp-Asp) domain-containing protein